METESNDVKFRDVKIIAIYSTRPKKTFRFCVDDTVWVAKQAVLLEFASLNLSDPLNYGFYMPPYKGKAGKFLDEERLLRDYPAEGYGDHLEFRYKRRIYRSFNADERKLQKYQTKTYQRRFLEHLLTGNVEKAKHLLEKGLDPNFQDERTGETPLTAMAAIPNSMEACMLLVNYGAYLDYRSADGMTALHKAIINDRAECITCLLDLGASPNYKDAKGLTALYHGILSGSKADYCELLLNERSVIGIADHQGSQEIHQACRNGREPHLDHLIFYGANVNSQTASGNTPLHICAIANQENCARLLLFRGADKSLCNYSHQTAYEVAVIAGNDDVAAVIENFDCNNVTLFSQKPIYSRRRRRREAQNSKPSTHSTTESTIDLQRTATLPARIDLNANKENNMFLKSARKTSKSHQVEKDEIENKIEEDDTGSEYSDSDEETNKHNRIDRRTFSSSGVGSRRSPAPIKSIQGANVKNRLYQSIPGRQFVATVDYQPNAPGELLMEKGDVVELLYIGEQGFWEGRIKDRTGWFPSACVEELKKTSKKAKNRTWFGKKSNQKEIIQKAAVPDQPTPKSVQLKRGERGYGFQLRGANSHMARIEFTPTPQFPALQYIGEVDKGEAAEKAGLKPGDFILEVNGEDVNNATHGHVVSLVANSGKSLTMKVITVAAEGLNAALAHENQPTKSQIHQNQAKSEDQKLTIPPPLPRAQYSSLTMGPLHKSSPMVHEVPESPTNVATVITLDKKVQRKRSVKSMWTDTALRLNQPDEMISEEISKGVIRRSKGLSMNLQGEFTSSDTDSGIIHKSSSISSRSSSCSDMLDSKRISATLPRRYSRSSSQGSQDSDNRPRQPPNYEDTLENMRRIGRKPSIKYAEKETAVNQPDIKPSAQNNNGDDAVLIPAIPSYAPPAPPERAAPPKTPVRSVSVPAAPPPIEQHASLGRSSSEPGQLSSDEDEPSSDFAKNLRKVVAARNNRMRTKKCSIDEAINSRKKEQNLDVIKENEESKKSFDVGKMTKSPSSDAILQNNKSDSFSLYTASSTSSLDTQYSKDSGIDVSEVMVQSPGEQPPDLASAIANAVARRSEKMIDVNAAIEQSKQRKLSSQDKGFSDVKLKTASPSAADITQSLSQLIKRNSSNASEIGKTQGKPQRNSCNVVETDKTPPPTRPKPKLQHQKSTENIISDYPTEAIATEKNSVQLCHTTIQRSDQIDQIIPPMPASNLEVSSSTNEESNKIEVVTPPAMFASANHEDHNREDELPPPPSEFMAIPSSVKNEMHSESPARSNAVSSDPPPPYSPPRAKTDVPASLSEKAYLKWTAEDVGHWLDFINMGQYKESFIENDIQGMHLSELSKEDLSELGVKKLGHRLTIDDSIGKLCRNQQFSEV